MFISPGSDTLFNMSPAKATLARIVHQSSVIFNFGKLASSAQAEQLLFSSFGQMETLSIRFTRDKDLAEGFLIRILALWTHPAYLLMTILSQSICIIFPIVSLVEIFRAHSLRPSSGDQSCVAVQVARNQPASRAQEFGIAQVMAPMTLSPANPVKEVSEEESLGVYQRSSQKAPITKDALMSETTAPMVNDTINLVPKGSTQDGSSIGDFIMYNKNDRGLLGIKFSPGVNCDYKGAEKCAGGDAIVYGTLREYCQWPDLHVHSIQ
ncbi:hypothetical protein CLU79DRAFT_834196 [Phycomyces nitens]|nr:hypothetical protein CLU79DRAFT_834196 [Phycomyces nitens]